MPESQPIDALLATPLFAGVDRRLVDAVRKEAAIHAGAFDWPAGVKQRPGLVAFRTAAAGEVLVSQGALTTELVVVLHGRVRSLLARRGRDNHEHGWFGPGQWFGEVSAHSHHPSLSTCVATEPTSVATLDARLFATLYAEDEAFRGRIDTGYRGLLGLHLRSSPLCRDLDDQALRALEQGAELMTVEEGDLLAAAGTDADAVYLVRAGAIACYAHPDRTDRVVAFYKGNAMLGEHAVAAEGAVWAGTYRALTRTTLVRLPRATFARLPAESRRGLRRAANRLVGTAEVEVAQQPDGAALSGRSMLDELHVMVERESVKGGRALVIDRTQCVRCNMCVESCVAVHDDGVPRLSKVGTPVATDEVLVTACYHCEIPQCMLSCDYAAIRRDPQGRIRFEYESCVGCTACIDGCPYGVIRLVDPQVAAPPPTSFLASLPLIGHWFRPAPPPPPAAPATGEKPRAAGIGGKLNPIAGKTVKCDLCAGLPFEACVYNCPTSAIKRREPQSLFEPRGGR
jgi:Fe-S-cluster-containing hydrogenase component 2/CRP-like cAMP-binding protein